MINSNELRIGNTIYDRHGNITHIHSGWFYITQDPKRLKDYSPIPLTPEVLLAAGFEMEDKRQSKQHTNYFSMWVIDYKYSFAYADFRGDWGFYHSYTDAGKDENNNRFDFISCGIKYLHQLQNLIHSLTGTELEIDITKL